MAEIGPAGALMPVSFTSTPPASAQREAAGRLERAGYGAVWVNEVIGKDALVQLALLLAATTRLVVGTSIANIWAREPQTLHGGAALLADAFPGRVVLGLGGGYPQQAAETGREFGRPLATMRGYRERMDRPTSPPAPVAAYPRLIAANGPRMLALAAEIADGALPAGQPPEFTAQAREILGPHKLLVVGLSAAVGGSDPGRSTGPDEVAAAVGAHRAAGADHVIVMLPPGGEFGAAVDELEALAPALFPG